MRWKVLHVGKLRSPKNGSVSHGLSRPPGMIYLRVLSRSLLSLTLLETVYKRFFALYLSSLCLLGSLCSAYSIWTALQFRAHTSQISGFEALSWAWYVWPYFYLRPTLIQDRGLDSPFLCTPWFWPPNLFPALGLEFQPREISRHLRAWKGRWIRLQIKQWKQLGYSNW